jgi:hypothetical protein
MESTMSPAPWEGDTWPHKSVMGLIDRMLSRLFPLTKGQTDQLIEESLRMQTHANGKNPPNPYPNTELKRP